MFRGKASSNRIELSRIVQDLLNFVVFSSLWLWGWGGQWMGVGDGWGVPHTCAHTCACTHTHAHTCAHGKHDNFMQMAASIEFLGNPWEFSMMSYTHMCACMYVHACVCMCGGHSLTISPPTSNPGGPPESVKIQ